MKNIFLICLTLITMLFMFSACHSEKMDPDTTDVTGQVSLAALKVEVDMNVEVASRAGVDVSNYLVTINNADKKQVEQYKYSEMPEIISLPVGKYSAVVTSAAEPINGFDVPFYKGSTDFEVKTNELTEVNTVTCRLANIMISLQYTDELRALLGEDVVTTVTVGENSLDIPVAETRKGYLVAPDTEVPMTILIKGTIDGEYVEVSQRVEKVKAGQHNIIKLELSGVQDGNQEQSGKVGVVINIDSSITSSDETVGVHPGEEPGIGDFPTDGDSGEGGEGEKPVENKPVITGTNFNGNSFDIEKDVLEIPTKLSTPMTLQVTLSAPNKIAHVRVTIDSETLTPEILTGVGLTDKFDLAAPGQYENALKDLGFPTGADVIGQTEILFDITQFTSLLGLYGAAAHDFIIELEDQNGNKVTQTLKIKSVE